MRLKQLPKRLRKESEGIKDQRKDRDRSDRSIVMAGQNTEKSPGEPWSHSDSNKNY